MVKKTHIIIHHTGAEEKDTEQVYRYHTKSLGWRDIGYNFVIERDGTVVKGRSLDIKGAHCNYGDMNTVSIGIALIGNFEKHPPTANQINSLYSFCGQLTSYFKIEPKNILGHKEVSHDTACPGKYLDMEAVRRVVGRTYLHSLREVKRN